MLVARSRYSWAISDVGDRFSTILSGSIIPFKSQTKWIGQLNSHQFQIFMQTHLTWRFSEKTFLVRMNWMTNSYWKPLENFSRKLTKSKHCIRFLKWVVVSFTLVWKDSESHRDRIIGNGQFKNPSVRKIKFKIIIFIIRYLNSNSHVFIWESLWWTHIHKFYHGYE